MNRKVLIIGGVALAAATAATLFFYTLLAAEMGGGRETAQTGSVVVAAHALPRGVKIEAADLEVQVRPLTEIPPDAFSSKESLEGLYLMQEVAAGRPVTAASLPAKGGGGVSAVIPVGMRAVSLHVEQYVGVNRLIEVGDRVDVMAANWLRAPGRPDTTLATVLQNVEVIATDRDEEDRRAQVPNVTVLVNADQAAALTLADQAGEIRLALRNPLDEAVIEAPDLQVRDVLSDVRAAKRVRAEDGRNRLTEPPALPPVKPLTGAGMESGDGPRARLED